MPAGFVKLFDGKVFIEGAVDIFLLDAEKNVIILSEPKQIPNKEKNNIAIKQSPWDAGIKSNII